MKSKKIFNYIFIVLLVLFIISNITLEILYTDGPIRRLSSAEYTDEVAGKINRMSLIYEFLMLFLLALIILSFVSAFRLLVSPRVSGVLYKVIFAILLYFLAIVIAFRGYSSIINIDAFMNLTGVISEHAIKATWSHFLIMLFIAIAKMIEKSITHDQEKLYNKIIKSSSKETEFKKLKDIIKNGR